MYGKLAKGMKKGVQANKTRNVKCVKSNKVKRTKQRVPLTSSDDSAFSSESAMRVSGVSPMILSNVEACSISKSISDFVRLEVANAMMAGIFNPKAIKAAVSKEKFGEGDSEFVKLDDLKDIVNKLIPRSLVESLIKCDTKQIEDNFKQIKNRLHVVEESLKKIENRVNAVEQSLELAPRPQPTIKLPLLDPPRLSDTSKIRLPPEVYDASSKSSDEDFDDVNMKLRSKRPFLTGQRGVDDKKIHDYDELIEKYNRSAAGKKSHSCLMKSKDPSQSQADKTKLQGRMAERRLFETNMLLYQKSPFTLHLNPHKDHFPNEFGIPSSKVPPVSKRPRPIQPRIPRTELVNDTEESQSDWLFEQ